MKEKHGKRQKQPREDNSRKSIRKQKRLLKKANRHQHYLKSGPKPEAKIEVGRFVKRPPDTEQHEVSSSKKGKRKQTFSAQEQACEEREREFKRGKKLQQEMEQKRRKMLLQANEDEEKLIKKLEKQLGMTKRRNKLNLFSSDGLDYLLEVCDQSTQEQLVAAQKHLTDVDAESDFEDDLAAIIGKSNDKQENKETYLDYESDGGGSVGDDFEADNLSDEISCSDEDESCSEDEVAKSENEDIDGKMVDTKKIKGAKLSKYSVKEKITNKPIQKSDSHICHNDENEKSAKKTSFKSSKQITEKLEDIKSIENSDPDTNSDGGDEDNDTFGESEIEGGNEENDLDKSRDKSEEKPDVWEDIYGRKRDKEGNIMKEEKGAYIPPHLRNNDSALESSEIIQLKRQIKGVLNKLAGTNLHWACTSIESLYNSNSRHCVNTALSDLWMEAVVGAAVTPDRMLAEHATLVAILQANVATEVGAHFLQVFAKKVDALTSEWLPNEGKHLENLTAALAFLYCFKICSASLVYSVLCHLLDTVDDDYERRVSCVLGVLRAAGGALRKDDPSALRTFIHDTQAKLMKTTVEAAAGSRIKYLLEVLMAVKNNNLTKIPNYDPTYTEHLKKMTRGIVRRGNYVTPLNVSLEDLLKADTRGKWWVVGSAWEGDGAIERDVGEGKPAAPAADQRLLELARKQRMNTDIRRSIFCIIMAAQDYMEAFEKLQQLGLKERQEREMVHVLLACCLQERTYNPYYAVLANKLCCYDRKFQLSIQYSAWDKIKDLENASKQQSRNLAQFLIHLILEKGLALSVLKVIEFSDLNKSTVRFMRQIILAIVMNENLQSTLEVFQRISTAPKLHVFRESLRLFIQHFLIRNASRKQNVMSEEEFARLRERTQQVDRILSEHDSKLRL